jgi:hypothetical protein
MFDIRTVLTEDYYWRVHIDSLCLWGGFTEVCVVKLSRHLLNFATQIMQVDFDALL